MVESAKFKLSRRRPLEFVRVNDDGESPAAVANFDDEERGHLHGVGVPQVDDAVRRQAEDGQRLGAWSPLQAREEFFGADETFQLGRSHTG